MSLSPPTEVSVPREALEKFVRRVFVTAGVEADAANVLADVLVAADMRGVHTHGVSFLPQYVERILTGRVNPDGHPHVVKDDGAVIQVDADNAMGHLAAVFGMRQAISRARAFGVAAVAVRNSNHSGAMAYYPMLALSEDMIGLATTQALPTMAPWGGLDQLLGNDPLAVAIPADTERPIVLDTPFQNSFPLKIELWRQRGWPIPADWAFDAAGKPTTDPAEALKGFGQPAGGYRGVGLALVMSVFAALLTGSSWGRELTTIPGRANSGEVGHFFMAFNIAAFESVTRFKGRIDRIIREIHSSRRADGVERILVPGEREAECEEASRSLGIPLLESTINALDQLAQRLGVEAPR